MRARAAELQVDADALARALTHDDAQAANPYGCNRYGHRCPQKGTPLHRHSADSTPPPPHQTFASLIDPSQWKPVSRPMPRNVAESLRRLRKGITVKDPTGKEMKLTRDIFKHWVLEGKTRKDMRRRLRSLDRAIMAIRQPHEIWQNEKGERIYLSLQQHEKGGKNHGAKRFYLAISLKNNQANISTYYDYNDADKIKQKQEGKCIYRRRAPGRRRSRPGTK